MSNYQELLAQKTALEKQTAELEKQLQAARQAERAGVIAQIKTLLAENGLTIDDLGGVQGAAKRAGNKTSGSKVAPKYRNPASGETWTGRGLKPKWLSTAIAGGKALEDFAI